MGRSALRRTPEPADAETPPTESETSRSTRAKGGRAKGRASPKQTAAETPKQPTTAGEEAVGKTSGKRAAGAAKTNGAAAPTQRRRSPRKPKVAKPVMGKAAAPTQPEAPAEEATASAPGADAPHPFLTPEVEQFASNMARLWEESGKAVTAYLRPREQGAHKPTDGAEVADIARTLGQVAERWLSDPARVAEAQRAFTGDFLSLWAGTMKRLSGEEVEPTIKPDPRDARFKDPEWTEHPVFDFLRQAYLHASRWADRMVEEAGDLDPHTRHKAAFYVKLLSNAASPSNFLPTNPELIRETLTSKGENLVRGMRMLAEDIDAGKGDLRIRQTDREGFEVGRNLAVTPGKVVFRNDLFELIQYAPATEMVRTRPMLIVPPWINKFYVLDLTPEKSMIRWAVEQGLTVFCISWVNPDSRHARMSFDHYMRDGIMKAVDVAREICGSDQVDGVGYCVGGTLLAVTLAYMAATDDRRVASATLMTTQVDFTHAGDLKVFVDEDKVAAVEAKMAEAGFLEGASMANAFNMIRSNDMIFPYLVNNYLKGKAPFPFDLLYWNSDATRMPAANHSFYLRGCYLNNDLARGRMEILGELLDLRKVTVPVYELATKEDHIAPAKSVFLGAQLFGGPVRFVLAGSGHIAGVVNPPAKMKYQHWVGDEPKGELAHWLDHAEEKPGSWWPDWRAWLAAMDATMVPARVPGEGPYPAIEDAPGSYVKVKA
jgi:polyhydroxyalkanoate synthase